MTIEKLRQVYEARPFKPFVLCLTDGRQVPVASPEFLWVPPKAERTIYVAHNGDEMILDLLMVVSIDFRKPRRKAG